MRTFITRSASWIKRHKIWSIIILIALIGAGYGIVRAASNGSTETRYMLAQVSRGDIVSTVTGSGQVSASNQVDLSAKASGELVSVPVVAGQTVKAGTLIAQVDSSTAAYELESARLSYNELVTIDPDDLEDAEEAAAQDADDLKDSYTDGIAKLASFSANISGVMEDLDAQFDGYLNSSQPTLSDSKRDYIERAEDSYFAADDVVDAFMKNYRALPADADNAAIEATLTDASSAATAVAQAAKLAQDAVVYLRERESSRNQNSADAAYTAVTGVVSTANSAVSSISSARTAITSAKRALKDAEKAVADLKDGPDTLDLRSQQLSLRQKEDALADYSVRAPFDGIIASLDAEKGDTVNSGAKIATLITAAKTAEISLNEIDAAKVKVGQAAKLTFDAIDGLEVSGTVTSIDLIGTVSQGVVSYDVDIAFDSPDERIKPGMTVSASIVTESRQNVLVVPTSAIQARGNQSTVQVLQGTAGQIVTSATPPRTVRVETGFSNDELTEIVSGLSEGDVYVARTIMATVASSASAQSQTSSRATNTSFFGTGGAARPAGGTFRVNGGGNVRIGG